MSTLELREIHTRRAVGVSLHRVFDIRHGFRQRGELSFRFLRGALGNGGVPGGFIRRLDRVRGKESSLFLNRGGRLFCIEKGYIYLPQERKKISVSTTKNKRRSKRGREVGKRERGRSKRNIVNCERRSALNSLSISFTHGEREKPFGIENSFPRGLSV